MDDAKIAPFGRDFDEAMVKAGAAGDAFRDAAMKRVVGIDTSPMASPLDRLEAALDELVDTGRMVSDMAQGLAGPNPPRPKPDTIVGGAGKMRPDGLFNRMFCIAADIHAQAVLIQGHVRRVNGAAAGLPTEKI